MKKNVSDKVKELFSRSTEEFIDPQGYFQNKLITYANGDSDKRPIVKLGADPTRPDIHLGHAVVLRKLRAMQDLGAKVIFIIGDFTAMIGDPSGKSKVRPEITAVEVEENMQTYLEQINKILRTDDPNLFTWVKNSDWYIDLADLVSPAQTLTGKGDKAGKTHTINLTFPENSFFAKAILYENTRQQKQHSKKIQQVTIRMFLQTLRGITHSQLIQRDMFQDRIKHNTELYLHEMMYPVLQGLDSLMIHQIFGSCDLEIGGSDQLFNNLMGRTIMKNAGVEPQSVVAFSLLEGLDGVEKMSKSLNNYIGVNDEPADMYGKVMSIPDALIGRYFELASFTPLSEVIEIQKSLEDGSGNPYELKKRLAHEIVVIYHGEELANLAGQEFLNTFSKGEIPTDIPLIELNPGESLGEGLVRKNIIKSKAEWRRLIDQNSVTNLDTSEKVIDEKLVPHQGEVFRIGKKRFVKTT